MNCISCGKPIEAITPFCNLYCKINYYYEEDEKPDPDKIYEVSNVDVEVVR
jgi:hypothetical protein